MAMATASSWVIRRELQGSGLFASDKASEGHRFNCAKCDHNGNFRLSLERRRLLRYPSAAVACTSSSRGTFSATVSSFHGPHPSSAGRFDLRHTSRGRRSHGAQGSIDRMGRGTRNVLTMALPEGTVWITALEAVTVAGLMAGAAVLAGIFINIKIETTALKEYHELKKKGQLPKEMIVPKADWDLEEPLYLYQVNELSSNPSRRNRPIREELEPEVKSEVEPELEVSVTEKV